MKTNESIRVYPGDIFCTASPSYLGKGIRFFEKLASKDNEAKYNHAGIIITPTLSIESLWTIRKNKWRESYTGKQVLIGRHKKMTIDAVQKGWKGISCHEGQRYPWWRLGLHAVWPLSKFISTGGFPVCSELAGKFISRSGVCDFFWWKGKNPDDIADMIVKWKDWEIIFQGIL